MRNVSKVYRSGEAVVRALDGVRLSIERGEFVAVTGSSGSGKSTLMNLMGCLDRPCEGEYILDGRAVERLSDDEVSQIRNREIGFVFQGFNLVPSLTALENVELPLSYRGMNASRRRRLAYEALDRVSLLSRAEHKPSQLSGGQQQRVAIARAIAASPPIILADEPTGNLDSRNGEEIMRVLTEMNTQGKTVILITHDPIVARLAHRRICVSDGRLV